jgi:hypothetical protein
MRIAILTSARTGSTSLFHLIERHLVKKRYSCISEPFNNYWRDKINLKTYDVSYFEPMEDVFIKTFVSKFQRPKSLIGDENSYWEWFFRYFDKVILLDRINKDLQSESLTYHLKADDIHSWQKKQVYDLSTIRKEEIDFSKSVLLDESKKMHDFAKDLGYPIYYFEDIYITKNRSVVEEMFKYIEIELDNTFYYDYIEAETYKIRLEKKEDRFKNLI